MKLFTRSIIPIDHPFLNNKYTQWYYDIINNARIRLPDTKRSKTSRIKAVELLGYTESHHIIPRCISGSDDYHNLIYLTANEHFICHWLLMKMLSGPLKYKMKRAFFGLQRTGKSQSRIYSSYHYEKFRKIASEVQTENPTSSGKISPLKGRPSPLKGKKQSEELIKKRADANRGQKRSKEFRETISKANKGKKRSDEFKNRVSIKQKGIPKSKDHNEKNRLGQVEYKWWNNGIERKRSKECPGEGWLRGNLKYGSMSENRKRNISNSLIKYNKLINSRL